MPTSQITAAPSTAAVPVAAVASTSIADQINAEHRACLESASTALDHAIRAGELLNEAKQQCPHGEWQKWLESNFQGCDSLARSYMRLDKNRELVESKRQSSADLSIGKALRCLTPHPHWRLSEPDPAELLTREQKNEDGIAMLVLEFDQLAEDAEATGQTCEEVFKQQYAECADGDGQISTYAEEKQNVDNWRAEPWFESAAERVRAKDSSAEDLPPSNGKAVASPPRKSRKVGELGPSKLEIRAALAALRDLEQTLTRIAVRSAVAEQIEVIRARIEEAGE